MQNSLETGLSLYRIDTKSMCLCNQDCSLLSSTFLMSPSIGSQQNQSRLPRRWAVGTPAEVPNNACDHAHLSQHHYLTLTFKYVLNNEMETPLRMCLPHPTEKISVGCLLPPLAVIHRRRQQLRCLFCDTAGFSQRLFVASSDINWRMYLYCLTEKSNYFKLDCY